MGSEMMAVTQKIIQIIGLVNAVSFNIFTCINRSKYTDSDVQGFIAHWWKHSPSTGNWMQSDSASTEMHTCVLYVSEKNENCPISPSSWNYHS